MTTFRLNNTEDSVGPCAFGECDGSGWLLDDSGEARSCRCRDRRIRRSRMHGVASVIPPRYRGVSFDRPPVTGMNRGILAAVRAYADELPENLENGRSLWFMGDTGTGKTTLAMLVSKLALEAGFSVAIYSLPKLLARIRRTYEAETGEDSYLQFFERLTSVDLLHLDDLGAERQSEWVIEQLYAIINQRYDDRRSVVVTTNLDPAALEAQIGPRTVSRLVEMCGDPLALAGPDHRLDPATMLDGKAA